MESSNLTLTVSGVVLEGDTAYPAVVLKNAEGFITLSVPVGPFEASAIILEIEGIQPPRPMTHDLLAELFIRHRLTLDRFELYDITEEGFLGRLYYHRRWKKYTMEVRPSDGIALALRLEAPIQMPIGMTARVAAAGVGGGPGSQSLFFTDVKEFPLQA